MIRMALTTAVEPDGGIRTFKALNCQKRIYFLACLLNAVNVTLTVTLIGTHVI